MSDTDIELLKLQIQREQAARDFWKWAIMYLLVALNPLLDVATTYFEHRAISSVANKAAVVEAKTDAVVSGVDASVKNWKAFDSKKPEDVDAAAKALVNAERLTERLPAVAEK